MSRRSATPLGAGCAGSPIVLLDRDGVINHESDDYIKTPSEWHAIPGSLEAIAQLNYAGFRVAVITNQSGIGRGLYDIETLNTIHAKMHRELADVGGEIEAIYFCPHAPRDRCACRKPKPEMLLQAATRLKCDLDRVPFIGDSLRDLEAARAAGATPLLVRTGFGAETESTLPAEFAEVTVADDLATAVDRFLARFN